MMKTFRVVTLCLMLPCAAYAQTAGVAPAAAAPAQTTEACQQRAQTALSKAYEVMRDSSARNTAYKSDPKALTQLWNREFENCAATLPLATMNTRSMILLAHVQADRDKDAEARSVIEQLLGRKGTSEKDKAAALADIAQAYLMRRSAPVDVATPYLTQFDALSDSVLPQKIRLHADLNEHFRDTDSDQGMRVHAKALIDLARRVYAAGKDSGAARAKAAGLKPEMLLNAYGNYADVLGDEGRPDSAKKVLAAVLKEHPEFTAKETETVRTSLERFRLIGKSAPAIEADHWFNAPPDTRRMQPGKGAITVLGFGAHWCPPCVASYTDLLALYDKYSPMGVQFMYSTEYYGYVGRKGRLKTEEETEATREYYVNQHHIPFPIAMAGQSPDSTTRYGDMPHTNFVAYKVTWIPVWYVVDRKGVIRQVLTSWEKDQGARLSGMLDALVKEKR